MSFLQAILLGLVQALTEYLPVSSSAHIRIIGDLMLGVDPGAAFTAIIQLGTELAVLVYFRHDIKRIVTHWFTALRGDNGQEIAHRLGGNDTDAALGWYIIIGTIPIVVVGLLWQHTIETSLRNLWITVLTLLIFGVILWIIDERMAQHKTIEDLTIIEAIAFGLGQMLALIPGVSRSGGTISVGRALGYTRQAAVRISFLMAIPAVFGAGLFETYKALRNLGADKQFPGWPATICATIVSFAVGYVVIIAFLKFVSTFSYKAFAVYRIGLAVVVAFLLLIGVLKANPVAVSAASAIGISTLNVGV